MVYDKGKKYILTFIKLTCICNLMGEFFLKSTSKDNVSITFSSREYDITKERIEKILGAGANVILTTGGIDDLCLKYFVEAGALAVRRCKKVDLKRIAKATGGIKKYLVLSNKLKTSTRIYILDKDIKETMHIAYIKSLYHLKLYVYDIDIL